MSKVIPKIRRINNQEKHVLCEQCGTLYDSNWTYKNIGFSKYKVFKPCPECKYSYNIHTMNTIPSVLYWIIVGWRILLYGRIDYEEKEEKSEL